MPCIHLTFSRISRALLLCFTITFMLVACGGGDEVANPKSAAPITTNTEPSFDMSVAEPTPSSTDSLGFKVDTDLAAQAQNDIAASTSTAQSGIILRPIHYDPSKGVTARYEWGALKGNFPNGGGFDFIGNTSSFQVTFKDAKGRYLGMYEFTPGKPRKYSSAAVTDEFVYSFGLRAVAGDARKNEVYVDTAALTQPSTENQLGINWSGTYGGEYFKDAVLKQFEVNDALIRQIRNSISQRIDYSFGNNIIRLTAYNDGLYMQVLEKSTLRVVAGRTILKKGFKLKLTAGLESNLMFTIGAPVGGELSTGPGYSLQLFLQLAIHPAINPDM